MGKFIFANCLPFLFAACLSAQSGAIKFNTIGIPEGLQSGYNYFLHRDSRGLLWISSVNGAYCSDGLKMQAFTTEDGLIDNIVQSPFFEDSKGNIWFSTFTGLNQYQRSNGKFRNLRLKPEGKDSISEDYYLFFLEQNKTLWLRAGNYLCKYDLRTDSLSILSNTLGVRFAIDTSAEGTLERIYACPWMNGSGFELFSVDKKGRIEKQVYSQNDIAGKHCEFVNAMVEADTLVWLFGNQGLLAFNPRQPSKQQFYSVPETEGRWLGKGMFWKDNQIIALSNIGPLFFDKVQRKFIEKANVNFGLQNSSYQGAMQDGERFIWLAQGVNPLIEYGNMLQPPFMALNANDKPTISIIQRHNREVWCATEEAGIFVFNEHGDHLYKISYQTNKGNTFSIRFGLISDANGKVWASNGKSLFLLEDKSKTWVEKEMNIGNIFRLGSSKPGELYVTTESGVYRVKKSSESFSANASSLFNETEHFDGILTFFGQFGFFYTYKNGIITVQKENPSKRQQLEAPAPPNCILEDSIGHQTWFGTTQGLLRWDWDSERLAEFGQSSFGDKMINSLAKDANGKLWVGGYSGLYCFDPNNGDCHHFQVEDGLPSAHFPTAACLTASNGYIWMGTDMGSVLFDPEKTKPFPYGPPIRIESFEVNNIPYKGDTIASEANHIELAYFQNNLAFGLKAVGFYLPKLSKIFYRLGGYENEWQELENGGILRYPKLPPGDFKLELYALNANGVKGKPHVLHIGILPPWWQTWWFRLLTICFIIAMGYLVFRYYLQLKLKEQQQIFERQKALQVERNRIAAELHDDLGAGLSIIRFLSDYTLQKEQTSEVKQSVKRIYHSAGELLEKMGDIIWAMNAENDNLLNLMAYLQGYAYEYLDANQLQCSFHSQETLPNLELSGAQRRNIVLAVKESMHNVVKHSQANQVKVSIGIEDGNIIISIHDNGRGIDMDNLRPNGNGVRSIRKRMEAVGGSAEFRLENGTVVLLKLPFGV